MATVHAGNLVYDVDIDLAKLLEGNEKAQQELENLGKAASKAEPGLDSLSHSAKGVSAALKMPEVNKLSTQLAQLTGKIGASSDAANDGTVANTKFSGALSSVAGKLGAGYVSNVGSATASLIKHAKAALEATNAQVDNARAAQEEAAALQGAASSLVLKAAEEKKVAEAAAQTAQNELLAAEAIFERKSADVGSLEVLLARQKESLKQAEANLTISQSEKAVAAAVKARNAVDATSAKIQSQSNAAVKEVTAAEDRAKAAREASAAAAIKLQSALKLEAAALTTVAQANDAATLAAERHTLATKAQAIAVSGARSALALLGGPTGILLIAAAGIYSLYQAMRDNQDIEQFKRDIDNVSNRIEYLTEVQAKAAAAKAKIAIETDTESLEEAGTKVTELQNRLSTAIRFNAPKSDIDDLTNKLSIAQGEYDSLSSSIEKNESLLKSFTEQVKNAAGLTTESAKANEIYDNSVKSLASSNEVLKNAIEGTLSKAEETAAITALTKSLEDAGVGAEETANQVEKLQGEFEKKEVSLLSKH
jgi:Tail length tape measure protein.